jgi:hypothetical protein
MPYCTNQFSIDNGGNRESQASFPTGAFPIPYVSSAPSRASLNVRRDSSTPIISSSCDALPGIYGWRRMPAMRMASALWYMVRSTRFSSVSRSSSFLALIQGSFNWRYLFVYLFVSCFKLLMLQNTHLIYDVHNRLQCRTRI